MFSSPKLYRTGMALRLLGPVLEVIALYLLFFVTRKPAKVLGIPTEPMLWAMLFCGFGMIFTGIVVTLGRPRPR